jgi:hypothetical protein
LRRTGQALHHFRVVSDTIIRKIVGPGETYGLNAIVADSAYEVGVETIWPSRLVREPGRLLQVPRGDGGGFRSMSIIRSKLALSHQEIAHLTGTCPEKISRTLTLGNSPHKLLRKTNFARQRFGFRHGCETHTEKAVRLNAPGERSRPHRRGKPAVLLRETCSASLL